MSFLRMLHPLPPPLTRNRLLLPTSCGYSRLHDGPADEQVVAEVWTMLRRRKLLILGCCVSHIFISGLSLHSNKEPSL